MMPVSFRELDYASRRLALRLFFLGVWPASPGSPGPAAVVGALSGQTAPPNALLWQAPAVFALALAAHALALTLSLVQHGGHK